MVVKSPAPLPAPQRRHACFNTILDLSCDDSTISSRDVAVAGAPMMLMFERARYGRNDTEGAERCQVPFSRNCDFDVQHSMSAVCGGRHSCSVPVNTRLFGDPCGYNEFLTVVYQCVHGTPLLSAIPERK